MCGLAGFYGRFPPELLGEMSGLVAHRGPDDHGTWSDPAAGVAFAHRRLSIVDLSPDGRQPMTNEDGTLRLMVNGEIYNQGELRAELQVRGHRFRSRSDVEPVLHLYEEEGEEALRRLNGIFALALWDGRRRRLLLARDPLGVKPLYYAALPEGVLFASELKALLAAPQVSRELDLEALHQHLALIWSASPHTLLRSVRKLEPGYRLVIADGRIERHEPYWDLPYDGTRLPGTQQEHVEEVRRRLTAAVSRQLMSDVPVGAFLSGGVDSSAVVAAVRRVTGAAPPCYTIALEDEPVGREDDLPYARRVAAHLGAELREVRVRPDVVGFAERMVYLLDEPQADPACLNVDLICRQARADGIPVLLSGAGGDDLFSGYRRHAALWAERFWGVLPVPTRQGLAGLAKRLPAGGTLGRRLQKAFVHADLPAEERLLRHFLWAGDDLLCGLYTADARQRLAGYDPLEPLRRSLARIPAETDPLQRMLYLEAKHFLPDHNLNYTDKMSMIHAVEVRVPLLDLDLVDYAVRLPPGEKRRGLRVKALFKEAVAPDLPREVLTRPKAGFGAPLRRWIRGELKEMVHDVLSPAALARRGLFEPAAVARLVADNERGAVDASYLIFSLMCSEMWLRSFLDRPVAASQEVAHAAGPAAG
jgi:asparagine synthase (glutamine-hydrolysing)